MTGRLSRTGQRERAVVLAAVLLALGLAAVPAAAGGTAPRLGWSTIMSEDFEGDFPTGLWHVSDNDGAVNGEYLWDEDDYKPYGGLYSAWPAAGGANALDPEFSDYPLNLHTWMQYGPFDLRGYSAARATFYHWTQTQPSYDNLFFGASTNGTDYTGLSTSGDAGGWEYGEIDLSGYVGESKVWIAFVFHSNGDTVEGKGVFLDDIVLQGVPALEGAFRAVGSFDGWVLESGEDSGKGGSIDAAAATLRVGDDTSDRQYRVILDFDTASLPDDAVVVGVTLRVRRQGVTGKNPILTHGYLKVDMRTGFFHDVEALERFDFQAPGSRGNVGRFIKVMDDGWYRAPLRAPSYGLINLAGTTQFRLRFDLDDNDDGGADFLSLYSGEPINDADRPELIITYYVP